MTRQTVLDFYQNYYAPGNTTLVITGNVTPETGQALARQYFGDWQARPVPTDKTPPEQPQTDIRTRTLYGGTSQGYLTMAFHAPSVGDQPDAWVMDVLLTYLGQGGNNRLQQDLERKSKLVTSLATNYLTQRNRGVLTITAGFVPSNADRVTTALLDEVAALRRAPLDAADLLAAKHALLASYLFDVQTDSGRANALGFYNTTDTYKYDTDYVAHVLSVTSAQVQQVAQTYLDPTLIRL